MMNNDIRKSIKYANKFNEKHREINNELRIKDNGTLFACEINDNDVLEVIQYIMKSEFDNFTKRTLIQQFMTNLINIDVIIDKIEGGY